MQRMVTSLISFFLLRQTTVRIGKIYVFSLIFFDNHNLMNKHELMVTQCLFDWLVGWLVG